MLLVCWFGAREVELVFTVSRLHFSLMLSLDLVVLLLALGEEGISLLSLVLVLLQVAMTIFVEVSVSSDLLSVSL